MLKKRRYILIIALLLSAIAAIYYWSQQDQLIAQWAYLSHSDGIQFGKKYDLAPDKDPPKGACISGTAYDLPCHADGNGILVRDWFSDCAIIANYDYNLQGLGDKDGNTMYIHTSRDATGFGVVAVSVYGSEKGIFEFSNDSPAAHWFKGDRSDPSAVVAKLTTKREKKQFLFLVRQIARFEKELGMKIPQDCRMVREHFGTK